MYQQQAEPSRENTSYHVNRILHSQRRPLIHLLECGGVLLQSRNHLVPPCRAPLMQRVLPMHLTASQEQKLGTKISCLPVDDRRRWAFSRINGAGVDITSPRAARHHACFPFTCNTALQMHRRHMSACLQQGPVQVRCIRHAVRGARTRQGCTTRVLAIASCMNVVRC